MTQRDRIVLAALAVVGVIAGFYLGVLKPTQGELDELDTQVVAAEQRRDTALSELQSASIARKQYEQDQRTLAVLGKAVPSDDGVPSLLYQLNGVARKAGVEFDSVDVAGAPAGTGTTVSTQGLTEMPLTIKFKGSFFELDKFLRGVHRMASIGDEKIDVRGRLMTIDAVALAPSADGLPSLDATVTAKAYVAPAEAAAAGAATASGTTATPAAGTADAGGPSSATPAASDAASTSNTDSAAGESSTSSGAN